MSMISITNFCALLSLCTLFCLNAHAQVTGFYWTDSRGIHKANIDGSEHETLVAIFFKSPTKIALDSENGQIYWIDEGLGEIRRANIDGSKVETILETGDFPIGIALDVSGGNMYWTEFGRVKRSSLDGTGEEEVAFTPGFLQGIALDVSGGKMYWAARNAGIIRVSNLDGTERGTIAGGIVRPDGVALDIPSGKVYWTFATGIARANMDGTEEEVVLEDLEVPIDVQLDLQAGKMYWNERDSQKIQRANLDGSDVEDLTPPGFAKPASIIVDAESEAIYWIGGSEASIRRSDLDISATEVLIDNKIRSPLGIALDLDAGKMYWADGEASRLQRANLDGSEVEDLLEFSVGYPEQIFLDLPSSKMYWTDNDQEGGSSLVRRANLDGSELEHLNLSGEGISDIDFEEGKVYAHLGSSELSRTIVRQNLDGTELEELVVDVPLTDLALDIPGGKLYWTEGNNEANIKRVNLDGTDMETVFSLSSRLNDLRHIAVDNQEGKMYWVNNGVSGEEIWRAGLNGVLGLDGGLREYLITDPVLQDVHDFALSYEEPTSTSTATTEPNSSFTLAKPYPNPFVSSVTFMVENSQSRNVRLDIYDMLGRRIDTLFDGKLVPGTHRILWEGHSVPSGAYMARIRWEGHVESRLIIKKR